MNTRNTAGKLGFIKDSEGTYRKGNFIFKDGKIIRESQIVPKGTIKDLKDDYVTLDECIRSILSYSTTIGDVNPRATNVYIDKVGENYKPAKSLSKNTVAVVMSNRQVMELKPRNILDQDSSELKPEDKPVKAKAIKDFSKPTEFGKLKKEGAGMRLKLKESTGLSAQEFEDIEATVYDVFEGTDFIVGNVKVDDTILSFDVVAYGPDEDSEDGSKEYSRTVELEIPSLDYLGAIREACIDWRQAHNSPDNFYESDNGTRDYRRSEFNKIPQDDDYKLKITSSNAETKWLDITEKEFAEIEKILTR